MPRLLLSFQISYETDLDVPEGTEISPVGIALQVAKYQELLEDRLPEGFKVGGVAGGVMDDD